MTVKPGKILQNFAMHTGILMGGTLFNSTFNNNSVISWQSVLVVEGTRVQREKPQICRKSLTNFFIYCCIEYTSPWTWCTKFNVISVTYLFKICTDLFVKVQ